MKITPIEIRQKTFEKVFRGYDKEEVQAFLQSLSQEWERLNAELREHKMKLEIAEKEVSQLREVETSLFKTLKTADDTAAHLVEQSKKSAELRVKEAQIKAEEILNDARSQSKNIIQKAEMKATSTMQVLLGELKNLERDYKSLESYKDNLVQEIKSLISGTLEKLARVDNNAKNNREVFSTKIKETQNFLEEQEEKLSQEMKKEIPPTNLKEEKKEKRSINLNEYKPDSTSFFDDL